MVNGQLLDHSIARNPVFSLFTPIFHSPTGVYVRSPCKRFNPQVISTLTAKFQLSRLSREQFERTVRENRKGGRVEDENLGVEDENLGCETRRAANATFTDSFDSARREITQIPSTLPPFLLNLLARRAVDILAIERARRRGRKSYEGGRASRGSA